MRLRDFSILALWAAMLCACSDDDFSTSPSDQPTPSADTISLGMLLTGNSSPTYQFKLYNRCSNDLRLTSIALRGASDNGFRMNVDGMNGTSFTNSDLLRIASGDSMFIFVEATFAADGSPLTQHTDYIDITCNGRTQTVVLDAQSKDVAKLHGEVVAADATWPSGTEVQIYDSLVIPRGVTLTIGDSSTLYMHDKADIRVHGTLRCEGTLGRPVTLRGDRTDWMFDNLPYDNLPAQWGSLIIDSTATGCLFRHTDIRGMSDGIRLDSTDVTFDACRLKNSGSHLIACRMTRLTLHNCELSNAAGALVNICGGWHDITHCTLANYNFAEVVTLPALCLSNYDDESEYATPLRECTVRNTLIWGAWCEPDVSMTYYKTAADSIFSYRFDHCLLLADGSNDDNFIANIWNQDPLYQLIDEDNYTYDFHVLEDSPAIDAGSPDGKAICPTDLDGKARSDMPTIGCYEY